MDVSPRLGPIQPYSILGKLKDEINLSLLPGVKPNLETINKVSEFIEKNRDIVLCKNVNSDELTELDERLKVKINEIIGKTEDLLLEKGIINLHCLIDSVINANPQKSSKSFCNLAAKLGPGETIELSEGKSYTNQALLLKAIEIDPKCAEAYAKLGATLNARETIILPDGRTTMTAQQLLFKAIEVDPKCAEAYVKLGETLSSGPGVNKITITDPTSKKKKDLTKKELFFKAIEVDPKCAEAYVKLAAVIDSKDRIQVPNDKTKYSNIELYLKAREIDPDCKNWMTPTEFALLNIAINPKEGSGYVNLADSLPFDGKVRLFDGKEMTKQDLYLKAIEVDPKCAVAYNNLGVTLLQSSDEVCRIQASRKYIPPKKPDCSSETAQTIMVKKMTPEALFKKAIELDRNSAEAYFNLYNFYRIYPPDTLSKTGLGRPEQIRDKAYELDPKFEWLKKKLSLIEKSNPYIKKPIDAYLGWEIQQSSYFREANQYISDALNGKEYDSMNQQEHLEKLNELALRTGLFWEHHYLISEAKNTLNEKKLQGSK